MAKRRKTRRTKMSGVRRKKSRVSGLGNIDFMSIGGALAGGIVAGYVNTFNKTDATTQKKSIDPNLFAGGKIALGLALPMLVKQNPLINGIGMGMIAVGGLELIKGLAPTFISGFGELQDSDTISISLEGVNVLSGNNFDDGVLAGNDISVINGNDDISVVNGNDDMDYDNDDDYL